MLSEHEAIRILAQHQAPDAALRAGVRSRKLFGGALSKQIAAAVNDRGLPWQHVSQKLDEMSLSKREKTLVAISPQFGHTLAFWWEWSVTQPYPRSLGPNLYRADGASHRAAWGSWRWHNLIELLQHELLFPHPVDWHATWIQHLPPLLDLGSLLGAAIARGNTQVSAILHATLLGDHPISGPCHGAAKAVLAAPDRVGWDLILGKYADPNTDDEWRTMIGSAARAADPVVLQRLIRTTLGNGLCGMRSAGESLREWLREHWSFVVDQAEIEGVYRGLDQALSRDLGVLPAASEARSVFLALWGCAVRDVRVAVPLAESLLGDADPRVRLAATRFLAECEDVAAAPGLGRALADESEQVVAAALGAWTDQTWGPFGVPVPLTDEGLVTLNARAHEFGKRHELDTGLLGHSMAPIGTQFVADIVLKHAAGRSVEGTVLAEGTTRERLEVAQRARRGRGVDRAATFALLTDRSGAVRQAAARTLGAVDSITPAEVELLEQALKRKPADLRVAAINLLHKQDDAGVAASARRLRAGTAEQQRAAAELDPSAPEDALDARAQIADRFAEVLGVDTAERTPAIRPRAPAVQVWAPYHVGAQQLWDSWQEFLRANPRFVGKTNRDVDWYPGWPLPEEIARWWASVQPRLTETRVEIALVGLMPTRVRDWHIPLRTTVLGPVEARLRSAEGELLRSVCEHLTKLQADDSWGPALLDLIETFAAALPLDGLAGPARIRAARGHKVRRDDHDWTTWEEDREIVSDVLHVFGELLSPDSLDDQQLARLWRTLRFVDEPEGVLDAWRSPLIPLTGPDGALPTYGETHALNQLNRSLPPVEVLCAAFNRGIATCADLVDSIVEPPGRHGTTFGWLARSPVLAITAAHPEPRAGTDAIQTVVDQVRQVVTETECARGDLATPLTETARRLRSTRGARGLIACVAAHGPGPFHRGDSLGDSRTVALSHLVRINYPAESDDAELLGRLAADAKISDRRLVEVAMFAPQWSGPIEEHLGWTGLESAIWWVHAHTKDDRWDVDEKVRDEWGRAISQRTPLAIGDLMDGACDLAWFNEMVEALTPARFSQVLKSAKYAASRTGHRRATYFGQALLGKLDEDEVLARIDDKRNQDMVRTLGMVQPVDADAVLRRYRKLHEFAANSNVGAQRRASEKRAVRIGLDNLARAAGYRDPQRLTWAMEAVSVRDLLDAPPAIDGDLNVRLIVTDGTPGLAVDRAGKKLKSVPAASAKVPEIAALKSRVTDLRKQVTRMRRSLEESCCLGEEFGPDELAELLDNPVLAPMLGKLVLIDEAGVLGLPESAETMTSPNQESVQITGAVRIAHPLDLAASGQWPALQQLFVAQKRKQPFKQVFRELYKVNELERDPRFPGCSLRYAEIGVDWSKAMAIFGSRGWLVDWESGIMRTFHRLRISVVCLPGGRRGDDVGPLGEVLFHPAGDDAPLDLDQVPELVFSETMRDLDLVATMACPAGSDPPSSESTIALRRQLIEQTVHGLGLGNVTVGGDQGGEDRVLVQGKLGNYAVHLGTGVVHRLPGEAVCLIPVTAQQRGRTFLPFADDDPRAAELLAKVLILAHDDKITDPEILSQLR